MNLIFPVNILNVEIKTRNIPFVLSRFHTPEDRWVILSGEWVLVANNLSLNGLESVFSEY